MYEPYIDENCYCCLDYAISKNSSLISFNHDNYKKTNIKYKDFNLLNCFDNNSSLDHLYESFLIKEDFYY